MGNVITSWRTDSEQNPKRGKKRTRCIDDDSDDESDSSVMHTPQRKKIKCTSKYIYKALFVNGENSDITIKALNKDWPLHKIYLCQSSYFASMFCGSWKESNLTEITVDIPDQNINEEALKIALGSLYRDDVLIEPASVVSVLAAASLLQLDGLIQQCADIMNDTMSPQTIGAYHSAAASYGLQQVAQGCIEWLERNLMVVQKPALLRDLSVELFKKVISSPNLFVLQVEMDVYSLTKKYVFLKINPSWNKDPKQLGKAADTFFQSFGPGELLKSDRGCQFETLFRILRLQHIINDHAAFKQLNKDKVIPEEWLLPIVKTQWTRMLRVEQGHDHGPTSDSVPAEQFELHSQRCGRIIPKDGEYCWRWTGYNFGVDLLVTYSNRLLVLRRNNTTHSVTSSVSMHAHRSVLIRVQVISFDSHGQALYHKKTDIQSLRLSKDEERILFTLDRNAQYPLQVGVSFLCVSPYATNDTPESNDAQERQQNLNNS